MPDVNTNSTDYGYANPIPGSAGLRAGPAKATVQGTLADNVVVTLGTPTTLYDAAAVDANPVVAFVVPGVQDFQDLVSSPMEATHFDLNPAFKNEAYLSSQQEGAYGSVTEPVAPSDASLPHTGAQGETVPTDASPQKPKAPATVTATAGGVGEVGLAWTAPPAEPSGYAVTGYTVTATSSDGGTLPAVVTVSGTTLSHSYTGLDSAKHYTFAVFAVNAGGNGASRSSASTLVG